MASTYKVLVALDLIKQHFGPLVWTVAENLHKQGSVPLAELIAAVSDGRERVPSKVDAAEVRYGLIVLLKHGMATARVDRLPVRERGAVVSVGTVRYSFLPDQALTLLRLPAAILFVSKHLGPAAAALVKQVMLHGVASQEEAVIGAKAASAAEEQAALESGATPAPGLTEQGVQQAWKELVRGRMLIRAMGVPLPLEQVSGAARAVLPAPITEDSKDRGGDDSEDETIGTTRKKQGKRGVPAMSSLASAKAARVAEGSSRAARAATGAGGGLAQGGKKRGRAAMGRETLTSALLEAEEEGPEVQLWKFDLTAVQRLLRHAAVQKYVRTKLSPRAGRVMAALLRLTLPHEVGSNLGFAGNVSARDVHAATVGEVDEDGKVLEELTWVQVVKVLEVMSRSGQGLVDKKSDGANGGNWAVSFAVVVQDLVEVTLMSLLQDQHGEHAPRVVRLLLSHDYMTDQMVADSALIELKVARSMLYRLHSLGLLTQQALPKFPNLMPQHTVYLYKADLEALKENTLEHLYHVMLNLRTRRHKEIARQAKLHAARRSAADVDAYYASMAKIKTATERLDAALLRLDKMLMLLTAW